MTRLPSTIRQLLAGLRALIVITVICGIAYPLAVWGIAQGAFHHQANGSPVSYHGRTVGSSLLCQEFTDAKGNPLPQYFQPRPSAASNPTVHRPTTAATRASPGRRTWARTIQCWSSGSAPTASRSRSSTA